MSHSGRGHPGESVAPIAAGSERVVASTETLATIPVEITARLLLRWLHWVWLVISTLLAAAIVPLLLVESLALVLIEHLLSLMLHLLARHALLLLVFPRSGH